MRAHGGIGASPGAAVADRAVDGRPQLRVAEIELRHVAVSLGALQPGLRLLQLGVDHVQLAGRGVQRRPGPLVGRHGFAMIGIGLLETLRRGELVLRQRMVAVYVEMRAGDLGGGGGQIRLGLGDHRFLQPARRRQVGERGVLPGDRGIGLRQRRPVVAVVDLQQQVAGMDLLVVDDGHLRDEPSHFRCNDRDVAADIGVVGAFDEAAMGPPIMPIPSRP